jgi:hypothetical protein
MGARILELEAEISTLKRQVANGRDPIVRVVKRGEITGVEMLEMRDMVSMPVKLFHEMQSAAFAATRYLRHGNLDMVKASERLANAIVSIDIPPPQEDS